MPNALPVRQVSVLPAASFRRNLTVVILAVRLMVPLTGSIGDFHSLVSAGHTKKKEVISDLS